MGRLDPRVKSCALRIIDENLDLKKWQGSPLYRKRERALQQARGEGSAAYGGLTKGESLYHLLTDVLEPYWDNPALPPHHPGFDKPEAQLFKRKP
jgi:hypothetical protein